jgi:beta-glucosidase
MKTRVFVMRVIVCAGPAAFALAARAQPAASLDPAIEKRVDGLLAQMTLEEKVGQLHQLAYGADPPRDLVRAGRIGSFLNVVDAKTAAEVQALARGSRLGIPLILGYDVIHGQRTVFPVPLAEASSWDPDLVERAAAVAGKEAAAVGIDWTFAPMVDIARDPRWGRIVEGSGEDTFLGSAMAAARVRGFHKGGVAACPKHYVGYGAAEAGRDYYGADISEWALREVYLPPFQAALQAGAETVMSAFQQISGVPASANRHTLTGILKGEWGFTGFVVSDWGSVGELVSHAVAADNADAARLGILAGVDMDMEAKVYTKHLGGLVQRGQVPMARLDDAVRRVLRVKAQRGLFEKPVPDPAVAARTLLAPEHLQAAREVARESIVLLKNDAGLLPLSADAATIAVIGPLAASGVDQIGSWPGTGRAEDAVTILDGIKKRVPARTRVLQAKGCEIDGGDRSGIGPAAALAREADAVVAVLGEAALMSGEAASRTRIDLPGVQQSLLEELVATGKPVVLVLLNGRPLALPWAAEKVPAILEAWFPGTQGGPAVADVLFGDTNPSGKLPVTFPRSLGQVPIYYNQQPVGRPPQEASKFTSKYLDEKVTPLFPFGYGLSYTRFEYKDLALVREKVPVDGSLEVRVKVRNTGRRAGKEVVQLYVRDLVASRARPVKELRGFRKVSLDPGQEETVVFTLAVKQLGFYGIDGKYVVEPGAFRVFVGGSSEGGLEAGFEVVGS